MAKSKKIRKKLVTMGLVAALLGVNYFSVNAGTDREFWNMSIRSWKGSSVLTTRHKETNLQYSWVKVTSMTNIGKVYTAFVGASNMYAISNNLIISNDVNTGIWIKVPNTVTTTYINDPITLENHNYNSNSTTGMMGGWVDYE